MLSPYKRKMSNNFLYVADVQPKLLDSLGEFEKFPWLGAAFVLVYCIFAVFAPIMGFLLLFS